MALFSIFGKKPGSLDKPGTDDDAHAQDVAQESAAVPPEETAGREFSAPRSQRDIARMTAEKIDAIESEIARDILKSPKSGDSAPAESAEMESGQTEETLAPEYAPTNLFHTTLIRVDKETLILFKEDMDE